MTKINLLVAVLSIHFVLAGVACAQNTAFFTSGDGGFSIDIPRAGVTVEEKRLVEKGLEGYGKTYQWSKGGEYFFQVGYYRIETVKLTPAMKTTFLKSFNEGFLEDAKKAKLPVSEAPYTFAGNTGAELKIVFPYGTMTARVFVTDTRLYFMGVAVNAARSDLNAAKILDSFRLLDAAALKAVKIEEATPAPLPQEPRAKKLKSDAEDDNLKGKIKSAIEDTVNLPGTTRERFREKYYDQQGYLTREIEFDQGYPSSVEIWGSIEGSRVSRFEGIEYDEDQRPPRKEIIQSLMESPMTPENDGDTRYTTRYAYKYDPQGRLIETSLFDNRGSLDGRTTYTYAINRREKRSYWDKEEHDHVADLTDEAGNTIETIEYDEKGKMLGRTVHKYELDTAGNWIVQRTFEKKTVRGKVVLKPLWITYRTITYY